MRVARITYLVALCLFFALNAKAQTEPDPRDRDTTNMQSLADLPLEVAPIDSTHKHSVKTATLLALIPGAGQIYNRKYWKVPIVYGALGTTIYFARENHLLYRLYLDAFFTITDSTGPDPFNKQFTPSQLIELQDIYRRYRDLNIILSVVGYGLQILDAHVDAHLFYYDIDDNLSLHWEPTTFNSAFMGNAVGIKLSLQLK